MLKKECTVFFCGLELVISNVYVQTNINVILKTNYYYYLLKYNAT